MPRKKTAVFVTVITALLVVMVLSVAMSVHHYEKTVLITLDAAGEQAAENETGLAEIRRQLECSFYASSYHLDVVAHMNFLVLCLTLVHWIN